MKPFTQQQRAEFERMSKDLIDWLKKNTHPHTSIVIDCNHAEVLEGQMVFNNNPKSKL